MRGAMMQIAAARCAGIDAPIYLGTTTPSFTSQLPAANDDGYQRPGGILYHSRQPA